MNKLFIFDSSKMTNMGVCDETIITKYYEEVGREIAQNIDVDIFLEALECDDMLKEFISDNKIVKSYMDKRNKEKEQIQKELEELYNGLQPDMPIPEQEKVLATIEEKEKSADELNKEVEEEVEELINKTLEVMKLWLMPFIIILSIKHKYPCVSQMLDDIKIMYILINVMKEKKIEFELTKKNIVLIKEAMKSIIESNDDIVNNIREIYMNAHPKQYRKLIEKHFVPTLEEKKNHAEVPTPIKLVDPMLDKVPCEFWKKKQKVFEPCCGKGNFVLGIFYKFYEGLKGLYPNDYDRCKVIIEKCLYYADISTLNVFITTEILKCEVQSRCGECDFSEWKFNTHVGDTLEMDIKDIFGVNGFDAVIGNPPYNDNSGNKGKGHTLWTKFIEISLEKWINKGGYLLYVNPSLWRQADHPLQTIMKQYQIEYLEIHDEADGVKIFNCNTRYDWYLINKVPYYKNSEIKTQLGEIVFKDLSKMNFIPNYNYDFIDKLVNGVEKINILHSESSYEVRKKWMSHTNNEEYKYPCVYSINRKNDVKFKWSSLNSKGMFGKSKVIFGSGATGFIIDENGEYGLTQWATGIEDKIENLNQIKNVISSKKFMDEVIKATSVSKAEINRKILKYFKKDFWKEFI